MMFHHNNPTPSAAPLSLSGQFWQGQIYEAMWLWNKSECDFMSFKKTKQKQTAMVSYLFQDEIS